MPYIAIKAYPKDEETKKRLAEKINEAFLEVWGCPQEAISLSIEEVAPDKWEEQVVKAEIEPKKERMLILAGEKRYQTEKSAQKALTIFHQQTCPFCIKARQALDELLEEQPAYKEVSVEWIEESEHPEIIEQYDYYATPSIFAGKEKLYEATIYDSYEKIKGNVRNALDFALKED